MGIVAVQLIAGQLKSLPRQLGLQPTRVHGPAAQQGAVADAAARPQDRGFFEGWKQPKCIPDLAVRRR